MLFLVAFSVLLLSSVPRDQASTYKFRPSLPNSQSPSDTQRRRMSQSQSQPREEEEEEESCGVCYFPARLHQGSEHEVEEVVACALCKDPVVEGDPYRLHLVEEHSTTVEGVEEIFDRSLEEGRELGEELVACDYCDDAVEEGDDYRIHLTNKHDASFEDIEQLD